MKYIEIFFWLCFGAIFYSYIGYGAILFLLIKIKRALGHRQDEYDENFLPEVTLLIAAYNEKDCIEAKVQNSFEIDYPKQLLNIVFVTDGSTDGTPELLGKYEDITVLHSKIRAGKIGAMNRAMKLIKTPYVVFSDANTLFNPLSVKEIIKHYKEPKVGAVAGEKRIAEIKEDTAGGAGEGFYWKYESFLKKLDSEFHSVVGAAGEIFSVRTELYEEMEMDTLLDDFIITLRIAGKGYRVVYEPNAYAIEKPSASIRDELKRKIRISAGGFQSIVRLSYLLNPFRYGKLTFQYVSHRVSRWAINPICLILIFPLNLLLAQSYEGIYYYFLLGQLLFYVLAFSGWYLENRKIRIKLLFVPFYFIFMHYAALWGFFRFLKGSQTVLWDKATRN